MTENRNVDRTTRLIITLTIFGAGWFLIKGAVRILVETFSSTASTKTLVSVENIIAVGILTIILAITIRVLGYVYTELKTFQSFESVEEKNAFLIRADQKFSDIFTTIKNCIYAIITISLVSIIVRIIIQPSLLVSILIGFLIAILIVVFMWVLKPDQRESLIARFENYEKKVAPFSFIFYIFFVVFFFGINILLFSVYSDQKIEAHFKNNQAANLELSLQNMHNVEVEVEITNGISKDKEVVKILNEDFHQSNVEVYEGGDYEKDNVAIKIDKLIYQHNYNLDLNKYLKKGENNIEIIILFSDNITDKTVRITNVLEKNESIEVAKEKFSIIP